MDQKFVAFSVGVLFFGISTAQAGWGSAFNSQRYYQWQRVDLGAETGAICGDGSEYKFFVNLAPGTTNTLIYMEGGGACWDYESCSGKSGVRGARNAHGIPDDYMDGKKPATNMISPLIYRNHPYSKVETQAWNLVYIPYCTGDIYAGDRTVTYTDPEGKGAPLVWHHNGFKNNEAVRTWVKRNLARPKTMMVTGCSAGGAGSVTNYHFFREALAPDHGVLLDDSGPVFSAPQGDDPSGYPSILLHQKIRESWGLNGEDGHSGTLGRMAAGMSEFDPRDIGTLARALSKRWPQDRLGHVHFWQDLVYSSYSYERFFSEIALAPTPEAKKSLIHERWYTDTARLASQLKELPNFGGYFPQYRALNNSHCSTVVDLNNGDIQDQGLELSDFIRNLLHGTGDVMDASEASPEADYAKPADLVYEGIDSFLSR